MTRLLALARRLALGVGVRLLQAALAGQLVIAQHGAGGGLRLARQPPEGTTCRMFGLIVHVRAATRRRPGRFAVGSIDNRTPPRKGPADVRERKRRLGRAGPPRLA